MEFQPGDKLLLDVGAHALKPVTFVKKSETPIAQPKIAESGSNKQEDYPAPEDAALVRDESTGNVSPAPLSRLRRPQ